MTRTFQIKKGLQLPISGEPEPTIVDGPNVTKFALIGDDYIGMKPTMLVKEGDAVQKGQPLFTDKKTVGVQYTSPVSGTVASVNRGAKRKFESIVIEAGEGGEYTFASHRDANLAQLDRSVVQENLVNSGLWTSLRTRPYSRVPQLDHSPIALFVTAIDTNPLAVDPAMVINAKPAEFIAGLQALSTLTDGPTYLCKAYGVELAGEDLGCVEVAEFAGPHPAGLVGTHIHLLAPVNMEREAWHIGYQDVIAIGHLFLTGQLDTNRVISIGGPASANPRIIRTTLGACLTQLTDGELKLKEEQTVRTVSGSVFGGRKAEGVTAFLSRYATQITLLIEGDHRDLIGWMGPGFDKYSIKPIFASSWISSASRRFGFTTSTEGSHRAIVPMGMYEKVMPLDIVPTPLLKSLAVSDSETAQMLGCLELDEEDLSLCTFVCPSKNDYGPMLRECLSTIEKEG